ncbi:filamentous hemagglutinin N-terminal domain-containing protein [Phyllobacterium sp. YR531]|uniref:two-partner secretion domain-containing protein n=1 Tax=Phyllobacterium sp. YR531 TaxID=1144343 RepID=UPI00026F5B9E|nr:filamentous hemagglutinin N-terminal domain-containing protein [Phyllobacterium sp. YR531]EJN02508.1 filamentous hemagglutinin family N-terminal domain containing protein [Phyllobacterium sp. YR531]
MIRKQPGILTVANGNRNYRSLGKLVHQFTAGFLSSLLVFQPALLQAQQVTPDVSAPVINQPSIGVAPNEKNIPLVDIVTPNAQGLSHNKYDSFNVGTPGLILNNHNAETGTSLLGGITPGNPNLKNSGPATVILNEVTKANRSSLEGQVEVFGGRADVIIANPNGITCNSCGFINSPRATLTTGTPDIDATGRLSGFTINGGNITFGEKGGNFAAGNGGVDLFDVVSRSIKVDGKVYGKDLRLTAGRNKFDYTTREAKALEAISGTPEYAIDGSALGAMQADRIKIVVTEKGSGVRMSNKLAATADELSLSADGKLSIGEVSGSEGVTLTSKDKITAKAVTSPKRVVVKADKGITLQTVSGDGDGSVELGSGSGLLSIAGDAKSGGTFTLASNGGVSLQSVEAGVSVIEASSGNIDIKGETKVADLVITATAGTITSKALTSFNNMTLTAGLDLNTSGGDIAAAGRLSASARSITSGAIVSGVNIVATHASAQKTPVFGAVGDLSLVATTGNISSALLFSGGAANVAASNINADGIKSRGDIKITGAATVKGQVLGGANVSISGTTLQSGDIYSGVDFAATDTNGGKIKLGSSGNLTLTAASASPAGSGIITAGALVSAGSLTAMGKEITADKVKAQGDIALGGNLKVSTEILGASNIALTGTTIKTGIIAAGVDLAATDGLPNKKIILGSNGDLTVNAAGGSLTAAGMLVAGKLTSTASSLSSDTISARRDITLNGDVNVKDQIKGGHNVRINGQNVIAGLVASGIDFVATAASPSGAILVGPSGDIVINATSFGIVKTSALLSAGLLDVTASSLTAQNIIGHSSVHIAANTNVSGQIQAGSNISITGSGIKAGAIISGVDFVATSNSLSGDIILRKAGSATIAGDLDLSATSGSVDVGSLLAAGNLTGDAALNINANAVSHQALNLTAGNAITLTGQSLSGGDFSLRAASINVDTLVSGVDFAASTDSSLVLKKNIGAAAGAMTLQADQGSIKASNLTSGGDLSSHASQDVTYNSLQSFGAASLAADRGSISLDKTTRAAGDITLTTKSVDFSSNRGSNLGTSKSLIINADTASFTGSTYTWGGLGLTLTGSADFTGATLNAITNNGGSGNINVKAAGITLSSPSALLAQNDLTLSLASLSNPGQLAVGHNLTFNIASDLTNRPTGLIYAGNDARMYVAGNLLNDQGAILADHDLTIAANASNAKNQSVTNISGLIRAENDVSIFSENLTNKRLTTPTWENVLVSEGQTTGFNLNPGVLDKPYMHLFDRPFGDMDQYRLYPGIAPSLWDDYVGLLPGQVKLADGTMYRAWTWNSKEGPKSAGDILAWARDHAVKDASGNPVIDPNNPNKIIIKEVVLHPGADHSVIYTWDEDSNLSQSVREDRFDGPFAPEALIRAGGNLKIDATELNNSFSSIEAGGDASLKGSVLNNEGVTLNRTSTTTCNAQGACEAYDADGNRDPSKDIAKGTSILSKVEAIGGAAGNIRAAGDMDISGFATVNNTSAPSFITGGAKLAATTAPGDPTAALTGLTAGAALFTPNAAFAELQAGAGLFTATGPLTTGNSASLSPSAVASTSSDFAEVLRVNGAALAALSKPNSGGFGGTVPGQIFLYETRAAFLDVNKFYGSGYFINRIGYKPEHEVPFLGDAYFENQLINTQLRQLVGQGLHSLR